MAAFTTIKARSPCSPKIAMLFLSATPAVSLFSRTKTHRVERDWRHTATVPMNILMERIRIANYADLAARKRAGLLGGLMFMHMKAGLDADVVRRLTSQETYVVERAPLSPFGVRKDFQSRLAELRTDLDVFTEDEQAALMACGYQMAKKAMQREVGHIRGLTAPPHEEVWPFAAMLAEITSTAGNTPRRAELLAALAKGHRVKM